MNSEQYVNSKVKILGKRVHSPNVRDAAVLESVQTRFYFFIHLPTSWWEQITDKCMENTNATGHFLAQLRPSNVVNTIFCLVS